MKSSDRIILAVVPALALVVGFWILVLGPKQSEAGDLQTTVDGLESSLQTSQSQIASAEAARRAFPGNYADLVALGAAAPGDSDQATLIFDIAALGKRNDVRFRSFQVTSTGADSGVVATPAPVPPPVDPAAPMDGAATPVAATPTEAAVATLPIGATVGPAGFPVTPYDFKFLGNFFDVADFFADLDRQVEVSDRGGEPDVRGRLMTVDGFALTADPFTGFPGVQSDFSVTTYVVPPEEGVQAGATLAGPPDASPVSTDTGIDPAASAVGTSAAVTP